MSGGITQLVAIGAQDVHLTGNPEVSFFRSTYKRHTNFSMTTERQVIQGMIGANNMSTVRFERKGDLCGYVYLASHNGSTSATIDWTKAISKVQLFIGGQLIDDHDYLFSTKIAPKVLAQNLSKSDQGIYGSYTASPIYPIRFSFCENWQSALPLVSLQYHDVELRIYWSDLTSMNANGGAIADADVKFECYANFVYLDTQERDQLANQPQKVLITQVQKVISSQSRVQELNLNHPIKFLTSYDEAISGAGLFSASNKIKLQINGTDVADYKYASPHFTSVMSYYHVPFLDDNVNDLFLFPFCVDTSKLQPTGSVNFSRLDSARITSQSQDLTSNIYAVNYNVLVIQDGMAGLMYAN